MEIRPDSRGPAPIVGGKVMPRKTSAATSLVEEALREDPSPSRAELPRMPSPLVDAVLSGNCVAFVGAGFSAAAQLPGWGGLLLKVADALRGPAHRDHVRRLVSRGSAHALDEAAQFLEDHLKRRRFVAEVRRHLTPKANETVHRRVAHLLRIPFRAILTTNFDAVLEGRKPDRQAYARVLRAEPRRWFDESFWREIPTDHVIKLHGDLTAGGERPSIVLTRNDYRHRLYDTSRYATFLRATLATCTFLYLGFSFEDAYFSELRSEVLSVLGNAPHRRPHGYALLPDVSRETKRHFLRHEGIEVLDYTEADGFAGFDLFLEALYRETNLLPRLAGILGGRRLLWVDPDRRNNELAIAYFKRAERQGRRPITIEQVPDASGALSALRSSRFDVVITHWGQEKTAPNLLRAMRSQGLEVPVVVFALEQNARRSREAARLGAAGYHTSWTGLIEEVQRVCATLGSAGGRLAGTDRVPRNSART
jgi:hypothetical protein